MDTPTMGVAWMGVSVPAGTYYSTSRLAMDPWIWLSLAALVAGLLIIITVARGSFSSKSKKRKLIPLQDSGVVMGIK